MEIGRDYSCCMDFGMDFGIFEKSCMDFCTDYSIDFGIVIGAEIDFVDVSWGRDIQIT